MLFAGVANPGALGGRPPGSARVPPDPLLARRIRFLHRRGGRRGRRPRTGGAAPPPMQTVRDREKYVALGTSACATHFLPATILPKLWAANPGCSRLLAGLCREPGLARVPEKPPERRLRAGLPAPQQMQNIANAKSMWHWAGVPAPPRTLSRQFRVLFVPERHHRVH